MTALRLSNIDMRFGETKVLHDISLSVEDGEFVVFVGPSGCGKSTLLRIIAGLEDASAGEVEIAGRNVTLTPPAKRGIAMVFQSYALYPHLDVRGNMTLALRQERQPRDVIEARVAEAARMLNLGDYLDRYPAELSGGQRQRVAIARAIVRQPKLFLFDEPLSNLDAALRVNTRLEIAALHRQLAAAMVYVTHDQTEAMTLADRIVVLNAGRVEQIGSPMELYNDPANRFVAGFLGSPAMNFLPASTIAPGDPRTLGVRPEHLRVDGAGPIRGTLTHVEHLGGDTNLILSTEHGPVTARLFGQHDPQIGARIALGFDPEHAYFFEPDGRRSRVAI